MKKCNKCEYEKDEIEFHKGCSKCKSCVQLYYQENKDKIKSKKEEWRKANQESILSYNKEYREKNSQNRNLITNLWRLKNKQLVKDYKVKYKEKNKDKVRLYFNEYNKKRKKNDSLYKLTVSIRTLISNSIRKMGYTKKSKINEILNCSFEEFKSHIESKFQENMKWENYGEWHLDHIYPISLAKNEQHLLELNDFKNFQPLWATENLKKSNKYEEIH